MSHDPLFGRWSVLTTVSLTVTAAAHTDPDDRDDRRDPDPHPDEMNSDPPVRDPVPSGSPSDEFHKPPRRWCDSPSPDEYRHMSHPFVDKHSVAFF